LRPLATERLEANGKQLVPLLARCGSSTSECKGNDKYNIAEGLYRGGNYRDALRYIDESIKDNEKLIADVIAINPANRNDRIVWSVNADLAWQHCEKGKIEAAMDDATSALAEFDTCFGSSERTQEMLQRMPNSKDKLAAYAALTAEHHLDRAAILYLLSRFEQAEADADQFTRYVSPLGVFQGEDKDLADAIHAHTTKGPFHSEWEDVSLVNIHRPSPNLSDEISGLLRSNFSKAGMAIEGSGEHDLHSVLNLKISNIVVSGCELRYSFDWLSTVAGRNYDQHYRVAVLLSKPTNLPIALFHKNLEEEYKVHATAGNVETWAFTIGSAGSLTAESEVHSDKLQGLNLNNGMMLDFADRHAAEAARRSFLAAVAACSDDR
jgi:tetratricopeptide (TPR) repeat protein